LLSEGERPARLRERKKARTRAAIQRHALRLFRERGYDATTTSQIAEAAEVSESTFFRYFPTKEDVVLWDEFDPHIVEAFLAQPAGLATVPALRTAMREVMGGLSKEQQADVRERAALLLAVPPLRAALIDQLTGPMRMMSDAVSHRTGRRPDDPAVRTVVGAMIGVAITAMLSAMDDPGADMLAVLDESLAQLEAGLTL
jgi:AcrR family transcriptional regulator